MATLCIRGFGSFVTSTTAPIATGWSNPCRAGIAPAEDRRLTTAHKGPRCVETDARKLIRAHRGEWLALVEYQCDRAGLHADAALAFGLLHEDPANGLGRYWPARPLGRRN
ncbi:MAG TPA: hypothetical protein VK395_21120 [Gemmataceae bacterium]|nr:hypothetical protein [Gemmataceae bacterium]